MALDVVDRVRNPWDILHGGAIAMLVDAGIALALGTDAEISSAVLHFLSPGRVGPVTARVEPLGARPDGCVSRIAVHDEGADGRLLSVAIVTASADRGQEGRRGS